MGDTENLAKLHQIFEKARRGDFSEDVSIPKEQDELIDVYKGVQSLLEIIREKKEHSAELDHAKDEFISLVSHELRTPMTAVKGIASMVLNGDYGEISDRLRQPLTNVYTSSQRQIHLINNLLNISRLNEGRIKYTLSNFSLQQFIQQVMHTYQPQVRSKGVALIVENGEEILVQADDFWVKEILNNLIANALKFTQTGSVTIAYRYEADQAMVVITDTGVGIQPVEQEKLFGKAAESGLGLYIARAVARKMGGDVFLEKSVLGQGSTFVFSLPKAESVRAQTIKKELEKTQELALNKNTGKV